MSTAAVKLTPAEYLARERAALTKSEYVDGEVIPMVGASREHNLVSMNIGSILIRQLWDTDYEVYTNDMRVRVDPDGPYVYPDVVVVCGEPQFEDDEVDTLLNPTLIVEVLSDSTEAYDRGDKFARYRRLDSLTDYVLAAQDEIVLEHFQRTPENTWELKTEIRSAGETLEIPSINCRLAADDVYHKVKLAGK